MIIGTDGYKTVEWDILKQHSANNILLSQGKTGMGKTTFNCFCINGASKDGIPCVIFDYTDSYTKAKEIFPEDKLIYFNVAKEGIGINPFKRQICYIDGIPQNEDADSMVYRILEILTKGLKITAKKQKLKLQRSLYKQIYYEGEAASIPYLYASLAGTDLGEALRCISKCKWYSDKLNWKELLKDGNILVVQLSDVDAARRYMFTELILSDLWGEIIKGHLGKFLICLDEIHNLNLNSGSAVHKMLRESRKYGVAMLLSTQFVGNLKDREVKLALEQAAQRVFFRPPESNLLSIARSIDAENRKKWQGILQGLGVFEYIFAGNGIVDGKAYDLKCKIKFK